MSSFSVSNSSRSPCSRGAWSGVVVAASWFLLVGSPLNPESSSARAADEAGTADTIDRFYTRLAALGFSGGVSVVEHGELILEKGYGMADRATNRPFTPDTIVDCGSITKQFTAAAILALEADGRLSVDDPIPRFFDDVPADKRTITLHHLLTHSAGLPGAIGDDEERIDAEKFAERAFAKPLLSEPGERYAYSNVGYSLLAIVVEKVAKKPYEQFLRDRLFLPLGIETAGYVLPKFPLENVAKIYAGDQEWGRVFQRQWREDGPGWNLRGNGGIHLRMRDMQRWVEALRDDSVLQEAQRAKLFTPHIDEGGGDSFYGYGWVVMDGPRGKIIQHNGGNMVFSACLRFLPTLHRSVYVVSTQQEWNADDLLEVAISILNGEEVALPPQAAPIDSKLVVAGRYVGDDGTTLDLAVHGDRVRVTPGDFRSDAWLIARDAEQRKKFCELCEHTAKFFQAALDGDFAPLNAAGGAVHSVEETGRRFEENFAEDRERFGELQGFTVLGTRPFDQYLATWIRLRFERGESVTAYAFVDDRVVGQLVTERAPSLEFVHVGKGELRAFSLRRDAPEVNVLALRRASDGTPTATIGEGSDAIVLRRRP